MFKLSNNLFLSIIIVPSHNEISKGYPVFIPMKEKTHYDDKSNKPGQLQLLGCMTVEELKPAIEKNIKSKIKTIVLFIC